MGTFGLGGLNRKSTWIDPVQDVGDLPTTAIDGSAAVVKSLHQVWEYDSTIPSWVNTDTGGGGGGTTNVFLWFAGMAWSLLYTQILTNGNYGVVIVEPDITPRLITSTGSLNFRDIVFVGASNSTRPVAVDFVEGARLVAGGALRSQNIKWRSLASATQLVPRTSGGLGFEFYGGGFIGWSDPSAITPIEVGPGPNAVVLRDGASFDGSSLTAPVALILIDAGASVSVTATGGSQFGPLATYSIGATISAATLDASSRIAAGAAVAPATITTILLDAAALISYDDTLVAPPLGASTVQGAIDALKGGATSNGADMAFVIALSGI